MLHAHVEAEENIRTVVVSNKYFFSLIILYSLIFCCLFVAQIV